MLRDLLAEAYQFQYNVLSENIDYSSMPVKLKQMRLMTMDDFEDGSRDPMWLLPESIQALLNYDQVSSLAQAYFTSPNLWFAQVFKMTQTKAVPKVALKMSRENLATQGTIVVELRNALWSGSVWYPGSTVLASASMAASSLPFDYTMVDFSFGSPPTLTQNTYYAIVVKNTGIPSPPQYTNRMAGEHSAFGPDIYPEASGWYTQTAGSSWSQTPGGYPGMWIWDFYFRIYTALPSPEPTESDGFLNYYFPSDLTPKDLGTVYNRQYYGLNMEFRFVWDRLSPTAVEGGTGFGWGVQLLEGTIAFPLDNTQRENKTILLLRIQPVPASNQLKLWAIVYDTNNIPKAFYSGGYGWSTMQAQYPFIIENASGVPVTCVIEDYKLLPGRRVTFKVYKNDDPTQVVFQTDASPVIRSLGGTIHMGIGNTVGLFGSRVKFDYFKADGPTTYEPESGYIVFRRYFPFKMNCLAVNMTRTLPAPGSDIRVRLRSAATQDGLAAAAWSDPLTGQISTYDFTATPNRTLDFYYDFKLEFIRGSPGPTLTRFDMVVTPQFVADDQPLILTLDEAGPGIVVTGINEEGYAETANSRKSVDGDASTQALSVTALDANQVWFRWQFQDAAGDPENRLLNAIILRNTNIKRIMVLVQGIIFFDGELASQDAIIPVGPIYAGQIDILGWTTNPADNKKAIGEIYAGYAILTLPGLVGYEPGPALLESGSYRTFGGSLVIYRGTSKWRSRWKTTLVDLISADYLHYLFKTMPRITFWPEPFTRPRDLYDVAWRNAELPAPYTDVVKGAGHTFEVDMEEI